jgi:hypothetical protein
MFNQELRHDPEKWEAVFRNDHARTKSQGAMTIPPEAIAPWRDGNVQRAPDAADSGLCKAVHRFRQVCFLAMRHERGCYLLIRRDSRGHHVFLMRSALGAVV